MAEDEGGDLFRQALVLLPSRRPHILPGCVRSQRDMEDDNSSETESDGKPEADIEITHLGWKDSWDEDKKDDFGFPTSDDEDEDRPLRHIFGMLIQDELREMIFSRLDLQSKVASRCVCHRWKCLVDPLLSWCPELCDENMDKVITFEKNGYQPSSLMVTNLQLQTHPSLQRQLGFRSVKSLEFGSRLVGGYREGISNANFDRIIFQFRNVEKLTFHSHAFRDVFLPSVFRMGNFKKLSQLKISTSTEDGRGYFVCADAFLNDFPKLQRFSTTILYQSETTLLQHPPYYQELFDFVARHNETLKELRLEFNNLSNERLMPSFVFDLDHTIPDIEFRDVMSRLKQVNLNIFSFSPSFYEGRARFLFGIELMRCQQNLAVLELQNLSRSNFAVWESGLELIRHCHATLISIHCDGCLCPEDAALDQFSCELIKSCKNLKDLQISICGLKVVNVENNLPVQIETLYLGQGLSLSQINYIAANLLGLKAWHLPQDRAQFDRTLPKISVAIFKLAVKLPKLETLTLTKRNSTWKRIRKVISYTQGIHVEKKPMAGWVVKIVIDRKSLELDRL